MKREDTKALVDEIVSVITDSVVPEVEVEDGLPVRVSQRGLEDVRYNILHILRKYGV